MSRAGTISVGRRERRKATTRQELLLAGRKLFSAKGLYESRVEEITDSADIGKGTLYRYFTSKVALIEAVVADGFEALQREVALRTAGEHRLDRLAAAIGAAHVEFFADHPDLMRILHQARGMLTFNRPEWRPLRRSLDGHLDFLARALGQAAEVDGLGPTRRRELAGLLFGAASGVVSVRVAADPGADIRSMAPALAAALAAMVRGTLSRTRSGAGGPPGRPAEGGGARR